MAMYARRRAATSFVSVAVAITPTVCKVYRYRLLPQRRQRALDALVGRVQLQRLLVGALRGHAVVREHARVTVGGPQRPVAGPQVGGGAELALGVVKAPQLEEGLARHLA